jgi:uncharacterized integral membrane protein
MAVLRTIVWVLISILLVAFIAMNWTPVRVNIWPLEQGYLYFDWPIGFVALASFVLGMTPMWLLHRAHRWRSARRIAALENSVRAASVPVSVPPPTATPAPVAAPAPAALPSAQGDPPPIA